MKILILILISSPNWLSFYFESNKTSINNIEFEKYLEDYKINFNLTISAKELIKNLRNTNILHLDDLGNYSFSYPYLYYFFAAKYFADNAIEQKNNINRILANLHIDEYAYIAIFISHHDKSTIVCIPSAYHVFELECGSIYFVS